MDRRTILALGIAGAALASTRRAAEAQDAGSILTADQLAPRLADPNFVEATVAAFDALISILLVIRLRTEHEVTVAAAYEGVRPYRERLTNPEQRAQVASRIAGGAPLPNPNDILPVLQRLTTVLSENGIAPDSPILKEMLSSFAVVHQVAVAAGSNDHWYCDVYVLELLCR